MNKGLIFDIRRFSVHDGPGIRTTVFMKGCPMSCWWCHNPESRLFAAEESIRHLKLDDRIFDKEETTGNWFSALELCGKVLSDFIFYDESSGGVTFSGGEPLMQPLFLKEALSILKDNGIHTTIDTCGYAKSSDLAEIMSLTDLFLYDLKLMNDLEHVKYCGVSNELILSNLQVLLDNNKNVVIRFPVIPGINDSMNNVSEMISFLKPFKDKILSIDLLPYHTLAKEKFLRFGADNKLSNLRDLTKQEVLPIQEELESNGFKVKVGG